MGIIRLLRDWALKGPDYPNLADLAVQTLENELEIKVLQKVLSLHMEKGPEAGMPNPITQEDVDKIRNEAMKELQQKYPDLGIELKK